MICIELFFVTFLLLSSFVLSFSYLTMLMGSWRAAGM